MLDLSKEEISEYLSRFIWKFEIGKNIAYNFKILFILYKNRNNDLKKNKAYYNKPIMLFSISIIEVLLVDLIKKPNFISLDKPTTLLKGKEIEYDRTILNDSKNDFESFNSIKYIRNEKLNLKYVINECNGNDLLKSNTKKIFEKLIKFPEYRDRIHIENYNNYENFYEIDVFTNKNTKIVEDIFKYIIITLASHHKNGLTEDGRKYYKKLWLEIMV